MPRPHESITESSNPLTEDLDRASPLGVVRLLRACDSQIFGGFGGYPGLLDEEVLQGLARLGWNMARAIDAGDTGRIVISGAGTSGRLAVFLEREFNRQLRLARSTEAVVGIIAGGDRALAAPIEGAEDQAGVAGEDLKRALGSAPVTRGVYIGISAALWAPYIAAQVKSARALPAFRTVVLGFNPPDQARQDRVHPAHPSMAEVLKEVDGENFMLLNPVIGPEAISGMTRLKSATTTKIMLEAAFALALEMAGLDPERPAPSVPLEQIELIDWRERVIELLLRYRATIDHAYLAAPAIADLVKAAGAALRRGGHIYYLSRGSAGMLSMIDAADCPSSFSANPLDVKSFTREGWSAWLGEEGPLALLGKPYQIGLEDFEEKFLPELDASDFVLSLQVGDVSDTSRRLLAEAGRRKAKTAMVLVTALKPKAEDLANLADLLAVLEVPALGLRPGVLNEAELATKLVLNAVSTGAHVQMGAVFGNRMVDLRLQNTKTLSRAIRAITELIEVDETTARVSIVQAINGRDEIDLAQAEADDATILRLAGDRQRVVPTALLLATGRFTVKEAKEALGRDPVVRRVLEGAL